MSVVNGPRKPSGVVQHAVWNTLISYISMNNSVLDLKGSYNGTLNGGANYSGDAIFFDGVNDYVGMVYDTGLVYPEFSVNIWAKLSSSHQGVLLDFDLNNDGYLTSWTPSFIRSDFSPIQGYQNTPTLNLDQWYMITVTTRQQESKIYLDGILVDTTTTYDAPDLSRTTVQNLGKLGAYGYFFHGYLKKYAYFNSYLTQSDVTTLWASGNGLIYTP